MLPNRTGVAVGLTRLALTWKPVPGVVKRTPRGELVLKKLAGRLFGAAKLSGTPSQLISRRPVLNEPATLGFSVPRSVRNASTVAWMAAASGPAAEKTVWAAAGGAVTASMIAAARPGRYSIRRNR